MANYRILIVDDEPNIRRILQVAFEKLNYETCLAENVEAALTILAESTFDAVLTDVTMPGKSGYELLVEVRRLWPNLPVVIMTAYGTIPQAVQAVRGGAFEYVTKPFDLESLKKVVEAAVRSKPACASASSAKNTSLPPMGIIAESPVMLEVVETIRQVADSRATVLISGESGVGKEMVAKMIHEYSPRAAKNFVAISCAALPDTLLESELFGYEKGAFTGANGSKIGRFELASEGTLFLDEIGEIPHSIQVKLLRVLQERQFERLGATKPTKVDVRLVTATNKDLQTEVELGNFRLDLLYRLQVVELRVPPLRERVEDIKPLARFFLNKFGAENGRDALDIDPTALAILQSYKWPGNVRELENTMERATVLSSKIEQFLSPKLLPTSMVRAA